MKMTLITLMGLLATTLIPSQAYAHGSRYEAGVEGLPGERNRWHDNSSCCGDYRTRVKATISLLYRTPVTQTSPAPPHIRAQSQIGEWYYHYHTVSRIYCLGQDFTSVYNRACDPDCPYVFGRCSRLEDFWKDCVYNLVAQINGPYSLRDESHNRFVIAECR